MTEHSAIRERPAAITLRRYGQLVRVEPALPILSHLRTARCEAVADPRHGYRVKKQIDPLFTLDRVGTDGYAARCWAGLEPLLRLLLADAGHDVRLEGGLPPLPAPELEQLGEPGPADHSVLSLMQQEERGLVRYDPGAVKPSWFVTQIALAWPHARIAVLASRVQEVRQLCADLRRAGVEAAYATGRAVKSAAARVVAATHRGAGMAEFERRDIVLAVNAVEAIGKSGREGLGLAHRARLYGFVNRHAEPSPYEQDLLMMVFGAHEIIIPRHGMKELSVDVVWERIAGGPSLPAGLDEVAVLRQGVWRNELRNRRIAGLAKLLRANDHEELGRRFPAVAAAVRRGRLCVLVLVENVEHGLALARHLRGWPLVAGPEVIDAGLTKGQKGVLRRGSEATLGTLSQAVVTATAMRNMNLGAVDVLVRADAGVGLPPFPDRCLEVPGTEEHRLLLVDFHDAHHPELRGRSRERQETYAARGWHPPGTDPVRVALERFLATRPEYRRQR